ncbi:MAG TPA: hypothetical protein VFP54_11440 [Acidimicrobiales bacterium]|nr:hypothetical protein [Acidimicrobiales bacterium]
MSAWEEPRWIKAAPDPVLSPDEIAATAASIAAVQLTNGMIPWFPGGHADPWNHVEAAMAMAVGGFRAEAERAYAWLADTQHPDGSWCCYYLADGVEEPRRDTNVVAYVATGVWHHYLLTGDRGFLEWAWPMVRAAINFSLSHQLPGGELVWAVSPNERLPDYALVTGSSSAYFSLRCAIAVAEEVGDDQPEWEMAAGRLAHAVAFGRHRFEPKDRWAMDWYYPVLSGALSGAAARAQMASRWEDFVMDGLGVRCVSDSPWVTAAETAECVMALDAVGWCEDARRLFGWVQHLRHDDGSYWTGMVHPQRVHFPGGERSTYTAAAVVLAAHALGSTDAPAGLFRGEGLPSGVALPAPALSEAAEADGD